MKKCCCSYTLVQYPDSLSFYHANNGNTIMNFSDRVRFFISTNSSDYITIYKTSPIEEVRTRLQKAYFLRISLLCREYDEVLNVEQLLQFYLICVYSNNVKEDLISLLKHTGINIS